jgi:hypothetical protein
MSLSKYINRLNCLDELIRREQTGNAAQIAEKMGISRSSWFELKNELTQILGVPIAWCPVKKTYYYKRKGRIIIKFSESDN